MNEVIRRDILRVIRAAIEILKEKKGDPLLIKDLSNRTIHNASIFQDQDSVSIAVIMYAISKLIERKGSVDSQLIRSFEPAEKSLSRREFNSYRAAIKKMLRKISELDSKLKRYIDKVITQAQIKKGSKLFDHGLSVAMASEILGISQWELMSYIGKTGLTEEPISALDVKQRLRIAKKIFNVK